MKPLSKLALKTKYAANVSTTIVPAIARKSLMASLSKRVLSTTRKLLRKCARIMDDLLPHTVTKLPQSVHIRCALGHQTAQRNESHRRSVDMDRIEESLLKPEAPVVTRKLPMPGRRRTRAALALAVALALGGGGYTAWNAWSDTHAPTREYTFTVVQRGDLEDSVTATGILQPRDYVDVGTQVSGQLKKLHVEIGSVVKAGQLLAEIDPTVYLSRVDADRAQLRTQEAQLADKQAQLALAEQQQQRQQNLQKENATTQDAVDTAAASLRSAKAQIDVLKAQADQTRSSLRGDEANLNYTKIYAPMAGTVVSQAAKQGQTLNANQPAPIILRIADLSTMTVQSQVSEADVAKLKVGQ